MTQGSLGKVLQRTLFRLAGGPASADGPLLERFVDRHDEEAFAELVHRHGPMVFRVCRRVLRHVQDAEDAFQATFIVLARKAASVSAPELLANWLYGVACRVALEARATACRRHTREVLTGAPEEGLEVGPGLRAEEDRRLMLYEEMNRLPAKYRAALVLCYLESRTNAEAAQALGCQTGAIEKRLSRARNMLRGRLAQRGVTLSAGALAALWAAEAAAVTVIAPALVASTSRAASLAATGAGLPAAGISVAVGALAASAIKPMGWAKIRSLATVAAVVLTIATTTAGVGWTVRTRQSSASAVASAQAPELPGETELPAEAPPQLAPGITLVGSRTAVSGPFKITIAQYFAEPQAGGPGGYLYYWVSNATDVNEYPWTATINVGNGQPVKLGPGISYDIGGPLATFPPRTITSIHVVGRDGNEGSVSYTVKPWP
jgi:RNA polymerase sigma factor (sigma-70 family)